MNDRSGVLTVLLVLAVSLSAVTSGALGSSAAGYEITISESIDVPDRTVSIDGQNFTISSVADRDPGEDLSVSVDAPSGASYALQLRNADNQIVATEGMSGGGSATFDAGVFSGAGLYYVATSEGGSITAVHPVVVEAYEVSADVPASAEEDSTATVTATLTEQEDLDISAVEVVVADRGDGRTFEMSESGGQYSVDISLAELDRGSYSVYVVVRGEDEANGENVPIGLSDEHALNITRQQTTTTTEDDSGDSTATRSPRPTTAPPPTTTAATATTASSTATETGTTAPSGSDTGTETTAPPTETETTASPSTGTETTASPTETETTASPSTGTETTAPPTETETTAPTDTVVTPRETFPGTTTPGQPGLTVLTGLAALLALALLRARRR